jgi:hypothetical protein
MYKSIINIQAEVQIIEFNIGLETGTQDIPVCILKEISLIPVV